MNKKDRDFIASWSKKIEQGVVPFYIKNILLACIICVAAITFYTWENIPADNRLAAMLPLLLLASTLGLFLGVTSSWTIWNKNNNRYRFLTKNNNLPSGQDKKQWHRYDRVWDIAVPNIGAIYFILLYTSIFLFDSRQPDLLTYAMVGVLLSYFIALIAYGIYRHWIDKSGDTKHFPLVFKYIFLIIIFLTVSLIAYWAIVSS